MTQVAMRNAPAPDGRDPKGDADIRRSGRTLLTAIYAASRAMKLYPAEHQNVQRTFEELTTLGEAMRVAAGELELRVHDDYIFVDGTRMRLDLANYASFGRVLDLFRGAGVGSVRLTSTATAADWMALISAMAECGTTNDGDVAEVEARLHAMHAGSFEVGPPTEDDALDSGRLEAQAAAKRTYARSVALTRDVIESVRMGRAPSSRKIKRAVQTIVDQVLNEELSLIGLTTLREYDEYTYTHSVNVCIFAVALGKRLAMSKLQLYELGMAALMHDIGKARIPLELLQKSSALDDADWNKLIMHPWLGMLALFQLRGQHELPFRAMVAAHEHHMKCDLSGYPPVHRPRTLAMTSRIVAVADGYDAATSRRSYQTVPYTPSEVLKEMRDNPVRGMDPVVVKAFIALLGIYPPGTTVVLDTFELAIVRGPHPSPEMLSRPRIVIVSDANGNLLNPPVDADLAARGPDGEFARTIIKTADPDRYGIRVSDYLI